jgi:hypothetical protein
VSENGYPLTPEEVVAGYGGQVACILRNTVPLSTENLRSEENKHYRTLLLQKLHARYIFAPEYVNTDISKNPVNNATITKMSTALASWKGRVKKLILKGQTFEDVNKSNPTVTEADYDEMKLKCDPNDIRTKEKSDWGRNCSPRTWVSPTLVAAVTEGRIRYGRERTQNMRRRASKTLGTGSKIRWPGQ